MKHHKHISTATLTALLFLALLLLIEYPTRQSTLQHEISTQVLRFHIRANSDTPADQQKKTPAKTNPPDLAYPHPLHRCQ